MNLGSFGMLLPFFRPSWCVGVLNSAIFNSFHNRVEFDTILEGLQNFGGGVEYPKPPLGTPLVSTFVYQVKQLLACSYGGGGFETVRIG